MRPSKIVLLVLLSAAAAWLSACEFSDTDVRETTVERVYITDEKGKQWDVTQAVVRYGFDAGGFKFGLGAFTITPIVNPRFAAPGDSGYPADADGVDVIGISVAGDARAYRLANLLDVELVDDVVGGKPVAVVHRPLVDAPSVCLREVNGAPLMMSASGWLYDGESVLFDYETESLWYRLGAGGALTCIAGVHFGATLPEVGSTVAPWSAWRTAYPATRFMLRE